jgi:hypothetical protein
VQHASYWKDLIASWRRSIVDSNVVTGVIGNGVLVVAALVLSARPLAAGEPTCVVTYDADRVTVHAKRVALADVVREIGRQSGAEIVGHVGKPRDVSQEFDGVPLVDALVRLLGEQNFTLRYGPEGKLRMITLLGEPLVVAAAQPAQATQADASSGDKSALGRRHRHHGVRAARETLPDGQVLVSVAGTDRGGAMKGSARLGSRSEQGGTGQEVASQELPAPDFLDRKLRGQFLNMLAQMDPAALADYFATPDGQRAQAFLQDLAAHHPGSQSQQKASSILDKNPGQGPQAPAPRPK